jgi:hypothetical protein
MDPKYSYVDDNVFPRLSGNSIGDGSATYGKKG